MTTVLTNRPTGVAVRAAISITLLVSGLVHAYLYVHGYHDIPIVGPAFLLQGSAFIALAILILCDGPRWLQWAAGLGALASLVAFALSRTVGLVGFIERGWEPPYGPLAVIAEVLTVLIVAASLHSPKRSR